MTELVARHAEAVLRESLPLFRVAVVNGPRQAGKSTLLEILRQQVDGTLLTLDDRTTLRAARTDPSGLLEANPRPLFIDEVQRGGDPLVLAIKATVDRDAHRPGQFVLAGSSRFLTVPGLSESLAGRARIIDLWPLSQSEIAGTNGSFSDFAFERAGDLRSGPGDDSTRAEIFERVVIGGFPTSLVASDQRMRRIWIDNYLRTLVERDLQSVSKIRHASEVPRLLRLLAARTAQELNLSALARDAGLNGETLRNYLGLLETIYVHHTVSPWSTNRTARAKKRPKLHMVDSGVAANLNRLTIDSLADPRSPMAGSMSDTFVTNELLRQRDLSEVQPDLFHYRDRDGRQVDLVLEAGDGRIVGIGVKAARDVDESDFHWLRYLRDRHSDIFVHGFVLHLGLRPTPMGDRLTALPVSALWSF